MEKFEEINCHTKENHAFEKLAWNGGIQNLQKISRDVELFANKRKPSQWIVLVSKVLKFLKPSVFLRTVWQ